MADNKAIRPYPWTARQGEDTHWWWIVEDIDGFELGSGDGGFEEVEASLFADSPVMLDLLKESLNHIPDDLKEKVQGIIGKYDIKVKDRAEDGTLKFCRS